MSGESRPVDRAVTEGELMLEEIRMDLPRLHRYKAELERNIGVFEKAIEDEQKKVDHVDHMIEVLEAKEVQVQSAIGLQKQLQEAIDSGGQE